MTGPPAKDHETREPAEPRITLRGLVGDALGAFNLERGLFRTVIDLSRRPHVALRRYLQAPSRSGYMNVWSYFLFTTGAMLLVENLFPRPFPGPIAEISQTLIRHRAALIAASLPISALSTLVLYRRWKLSYAEHLVIAAFVSAQLQFFWLVIHPPVVLGVHPTFRVLAALVLTLYPAAVFWLFDQPAGPWRVARSVLGAFCYLGGQVVVGAVFMALLLMFR